MAGGRGGVQKPVTFETHEMTDWDGQKYKIQQRGDAFTITQTKAGASWDISVLNLKILKQFPNGYTICQAQDGQTFDFNMNPDNPIMGKLQIAKIINSSGSFITSRKNGPETNDKTFAYVSADSAQGFFPGERKQLESKDFSKLLDLAKDYEESIHYEDIKNNINVEQFEKALNLSSKNISNSCAKQNSNKANTMVVNYGNDSSYINADIHDREHKVISELDLVVDNRKSDEIQKRSTYEQGKGYALYQRRDNGKFILDNEIPFDHLEVDSYTELSNGRLTCSYKDEQGKDAYVYVDADGRTAEIDKDTFAKANHLEDDYKWRLDRAQNRQGDIRDGKVGEIMQKIKAGDEKFNF